MSEDTTMFEMPPSAENAPTISKPTKFLMSTRRLVDSERNLLGLAFIRATRERSYLPAPRRSVSDSGGDRGKRRASRRSTELKYIH